MTVGEMAGAERRGTTALDGYIKKAEKGGLVSHVTHSLRGRNGERRYMLTRAGVRALVEVEAERDVPRSEVLERVGTSGRGLARYYELIDMLAGLSAEGLEKVLRRLSKHGLVHRVQVRRNDWRMALTKQGIRFICRAARAAPNKALSLVVGTARQRLVRGE